MTIRIQMLEGASLVLTDQTWDTWVAISQKLAAAKAKGEMFVVQQPERLQGTLINPEHVIRAWTER